MKSFGVNYATDFPTHSNISQLGFIVASGLLHLVIITETILNKHLINLRYKASAREPIFKQLSQKSKIFLSLTKRKPDWQKYEGIEYGIEYKMYFNSFNFLRLSYASV